MEGGASPDFSISMWSAARFGRVDVNAMTEQRRNYRDCRPELFGDTVEAVPQGYAA
jgi:hypothetical protein